VTTRLSKPVSRETGALIFSKGHRAIVVTLHDTFIELRLKGTRKCETAELGTIYRMAVRDRVFAERAAKRKAKAKKA
jgi:hypothetical protein